MKHRANGHWEIVWETDERGNPYPVSVFIVNGHEEARHATLVLNWD